MRDCETNNTLPGPASEPRCAEVELLRLPRRRDDLHVEQLDGEGLVYDQLSGAVHRLNATTFFVWNACDGSQTPQGIARSLMNNYSVDRDEAVKVVAHVVARLQEKGLLQMCGADQAGRAGSSGDARQTGGETISRRELLGGGITKAVLAAPVVSTFFASGAHASGPSASGAFGPGGCKEGQYSCFVDTDCCQAPADRKCEDGTCCVKLNQPCNEDADCCDNALSGCVDDRCRP